MSLRKRAISGAISGTIGTVLNFGQALLLVPLLLRVWGRDAYGVWVAVLAALGVLTALDTGHQNFVGNELNRLHHLDRDAARKILASALLVGALLGVLQLNLVLGVLATGLSEKLLGLSSGTLSAHRANIALLILVAGWGVSGSVGGVLVRLYAPVGRFARGQTMGIIGRLLQLAATAVMSICGRTIVETAAVIAALSLLYTIVVVADVGKSAPEYWPWWTGPSLSLGLKNLFRSGVLLTISVLQQLSGNGLTLLVASALSATAIPAFATSRTIANVLTQMSNIVLQPLYPDLVRLYATKASTGLRNVMIASWMVVTGAAVLAGVLILPILKPTYLWWTGRLLAFDRPLILGLIIAAMVRSVGVPFLALIAASNRLRYQLICVSAQVVITLLVSWALVSRFGTVGVSMGLVAGEAVGGAALPIFVGRRSLRQIDADVAWGDVLWQCALVLVGASILVVSAWLDQSVFLAYPLMLACLLGMLWRRFYGLPGSLRSALISRKR